jgi:hypothetical protein
MIDGENNNDVSKDEPPSRLHAFPMLIGRNDRGQWVVRSQDGQCGGLFINRTEALRFALFENGHRPEAVIMVGNLELTMTDGRNDNVTGSVDNGPAQYQSRPAFATRLVA